MQQHRLPEELSCTTLDLVSRRASLGPFSYNILLNIGVLVIIMSGENLKCPFLVVTAIVRGYYKMRKRINSLKWTFLKLLPYRRSRFLGCLRKLEAESVNVPEYQLQLTDLHTVGR